MGQNWSTEYINNPYTKAKDELDKLGAIKLPQAEETLTTYAQIYEQGLSAMYEAFIKLAGRSRDKTIKLVISDKRVFGKLPETEFAPCNPYQHIFQHEDGVI